MGSVETATSPHSHWRAIDEPRSTRVGVIGCGVSGIGIYIRLRQYVPDARITIFEKNPSIGGTWYENRYPGVACDIPSHTYQYTFEPHTQWSRFFSPGEEILDYVKGVSNKYKVNDAVRLNSKVVEATWDEGTGTWNVTVEHGPPGAIETQHHEFEVLISATGVLNNWRWPEIKGLDSFEGKRLHSARWDTEW